MRGKSIKIKNALKTIKNDELRTKIVKPQNLFVSSAVSFLCENAYFDRKNRGVQIAPFLRGRGCKLHFFRSKGVQNLRLKRGEGVQNRVIVFLCGAKWIHKIVNRTFDKTQRLITLELIPLVIEIIEKNVKI